MSEQRQPAVIHSNAVYDRQQAQQALGLAKDTLGREIRLGRLRASKRGGRYYILGEWLLDWIRQGEVVRRPRAADPDGRKAG
jgi:hypothetical protein